MQQVKAIISQNIWWLGLVTLAIIIGGYMLWSISAHWAPPRDEYETQGIVVDRNNGTPAWETLAATGVDFAYLTATEGTHGRDPSFAGNLAGAKGAGMRYGALHRFDICKPATEQAGLFITIVPRSADALPPAVQLDFPDNCNERPGRSIILSDLVTFLAQIEIHSGRPAILMIAKDFEKIYHISRSVDRNVWAENNWFAPGYTDRPWVMWTANNARYIDGVDGPVRWAVVRK